MAESNSRLIVKVRYRKPGGADGTQAAAKGYVKYIGTREGAVRMTVDNADGPATKPQTKLIADILHEAPDAAKLSSYGAYKEYGTIEAASSFIDEAIDEYGYQIVGLARYAKYMATRPMANHISNSGLFGETKNPEDNENREVNLEEIQRELSECQSNVYLPILSLRGDDSIATGYDNPEAWKKLIERHRNDFCRWFKIPPENLRWVAAYHNAENSKHDVHNHIHMLIWSTNKNDGWVSPQAIDDMRMTLAKDIFSNELNALYEEKNKLRDDAREEARQTVHELADRIKVSPGSANDLLAMDMMVLADGLRGYKGRKYYRYLSRENKMVVNAIVDKLPESDPRLKKMLDAWAATKDKQIKVYSKGEYVMPPLSQIRDFKTIKNDTISAAYEISLALDENGELTDEQMEEALHGSGPAGKKLMSAMARLSGDLAKTIEHKAGHSKARGHQYQQMTKEDYEHMQASQIKL